jgi:molybdate transport system substrate-binding protein
MISKPLVAAATGAVILMATHVPAHAAELKVLGAIGMRQVMLDLRPKFERATGHTLAITFDSTGLIAKRIASGEKVDVVMINRSAIDTLAKDGKVIVGSVADIARSVAAVGVRNGAKPDISSPEAFKRLLLSAKSVARPSPAVGGSSGDHIVKVLERLGIAGEVNAKSVIVTTGHPGQVAESPGDAVAKGKAEIALHQLQELMAVPGIDIAGPFPGELQGNFAFTAAIGTNASEPEAGKALIEFLHTRDAMVVIRAKGMEPVAP